MIFYGNEWSLLLFDILVFAIVDLIAQNYVLAAIITYIIGWVSSNFFCILTFAYSYRLYDMQETTLEKVTWEERL